MKRTIKGVVFDMDGTLTIPYLNFSLMRQRLGLKPNDDIVHKLNELTGEDRARAEAIIREMEEEALVNTRLQPGLATLMQFLEKIPVHKAILTRNALESVEYVIENHITDFKFHPIVTRSFIPPKPAPDAIHHIAAGWNIDPSDTVMIGDSKDDMACGKAAGSITILLRNEKNAQLTDEADFVVDSLEHIVGILQSEAISLDPHVAIDRTIEP